jgi:hypothetical protein
VRGGISGANTLKTSGVQRPALGEVAVNRKVRLASIFCCSKAQSGVKNSKLKLSKDKAPEVGQKRARSSSVADGPQRVLLAVKPTAPEQTTVTGVRSSLPQRPPLAQTLPQRVFSRPEPTALYVEGVAHLDGPEDNMDVEEVHSTKRDSMDDVVVVGDEELDNMIEEQDRAEVLENLVPAEKEEAAEYTWPEASPNHAAKYQREVEEIRARFDAEDEEYDSTMCSEYAEDIFLYMGDLQVRSHHAFLTT